VALVVLLVGLGLTACGEDAAPSRSFTYSISDTGGNLSTADGRRVVVVHLPFTGANCSSITGLAGGIQHTADAPVSTPGSVVLSFTLSFGGPYLETIYIDLNGTNTLDSGDQVWGMDPNDAAGPCYNNISSVPSSMFIDWTTFSQVGTTTYTGSAQPWSAGTPALPSAGGWMTLSAGQ
jgi:hypothetical protein